MNWLKEVFESSCGAKMRILTLVVRNLAYYRRLHVGVVAGVAVGTAVLVGALCAGDSVRHSLKLIADYRLGRTDVALASGERYFRAALADEFAAKLKADAAAALQLRGVAINPETDARINVADVIGVDGAFWRFGPGAGFGDLADDEAVLSAKTAERLGLRVGDALVLKMEKLDAMPRDTPMAVDDAAVTARLKVKAVAGDDQFGRFSLKANQVAPYNVFVSRKWLAARMKIADRANLMLAGGRTDTRITGEEAGKGLADVWQLADAGLEVRELPAIGMLELRSSRVFLDAAVTETALAALPGARGVFTYFVNRVTKGDAQSPYGFVSAPGEPLVATNMRPDEIVINEWLAEDVGAHVGDTVTVSYYVFGPARELMETNSSFTVRSIVPISGPAADGDLMPQFPGLADAGSCKDWKPGVPVNLSQIRKKDEDYWAKYRGTPRAFVTLEAAQKMWRNRFGDLTALRCPAQGTSVSNLTQTLRSRLDPVSVSLVIRPVRAEGDKATAQAMDFGELFISLSIFIVAAALMLTGLLFILAAENRTEEMGLLLALGFTPKKVRRMFMGEGVFLALVGCVIGAGLGLAYNEAVVHGLKTIWRDAVGISSLVSHIEPGSVIGGAVAGMVTAVVAMWISVRRIVHRPIVELQQAGGQAMVMFAGGRRWISVVVAVLSAIGVVVILAKSSGNDAKVAESFFGAGALLLIFGMAASNIALHKMARSAVDGVVRMGTLGARNCGRRRGRSLATIGLLASGVFVVIAVGANRHSVGREVLKRESGTGGFAFYGETAVPVTVDLNTATAREKLGITGPVTGALSVVQMRVREGDDASCLNLNRAQQPRLLGVPATKLAERGSFTFAKTMWGKLPVSEVWGRLEQRLDASTIPGVADQAVLQWTLQKPVGSVVVYTDERGRKLNVKLVGGLENSIFQGSILVSEKLLTEHFPSISGYRAMLVDAPEKSAADADKALSKALRDYGVDLTPAGKRLAEFMAVENTYLSIFLSLGGLGVILGSIGMGIVVLRNILERKTEMAMLRAVGFSRPALQWLVLLEHLVLLGVGFACGMVSALVAVWPSLSSTGAGSAPSAMLVVILAGVAVNGLVWTVLATLPMARADLLAGLRNE